MAEYSGTGPKIVGRGMAQAFARPDRGDARHRRSRAADHRTRRRLQAVHAGPDPVDGAERDGSASIAC